MEVLTPVVLTGLVNLVLKKLVVKQCTSVENTLKIQHNVINQNQIMNLA